MFFEIFIFLCFVILLDYLNKKRRNDMIAKLKGPIALPLIGNVYMLFNKTPEDIIHFIIKSRNKYGNLFRVWIFNQLSVFSCNPEDIEIILSNPKYITKTTLYDTLQIWLGKGLLLNTGLKWYLRRKIITPAFHFKILEQYVNIFDQQSSILVEKLKVHQDNRKSFNIESFIVLASLDIVTETSMGVTINAQSNADHEYVHAVHDITEILTRRFIKVFHRSELIFQLTAPAMKRKQDKTIKILHNFTEKIILERRQTLEESVKQHGTQLDKNNDDDFGYKKRMAFLDILLQSTIDGKSLTNSDIREEVDTFMFEGHDTVTSALCFTLYLISRHPEIQNKLFQEIRQVIGNDKYESVKYQDLMELKYLELVIKESMRLYPSVPIIGRLFPEDVNINGKIIPAGTNYTIGLFVMFRDKEIFPDPDKFIPERHLNNKNNPYAYIPFSAGPRNCIGQKFAMLEMKSVISKILRYYELLPMGPEIKPILNLLMRSTNGFHLGIKIRNY